MSEPNIGRLYPCMGEFWKHTKTKKTYTILRKCRLKETETRKWGIGVVYQDEVDLYVRDIDDFMKRFMNVLEEGE